QQSASEEPFLTDRGHQGHGKGGGNVEPKVVAPQELPDHLLVFCFARLQRGYQLGQRGHEEVCEDRHRKEGKDCDEVGASAQWLMRNLLLIPDLVEREREQENSPNLGEDQRDLLRKECGKRGADDDVRE